MSWLTQKEPGKGNQNLERFLDFYLLKFALFISIFFFFTLTKNGGKESKMD